MELKTRLNVRPGLSTTPGERQSALRPIAIRRKSHAKVTRQSVLNPFVVRAVRIMSGQVVVLSKYPQWSVEYLQVRHRAMRVCRFLNGNSHHPWRSGDIPQEDQEGGSDPVQDAAPSGDRLHWQPPLLGSVWHGYGVDVDRNPRSRQHNDADAGCYQHPTPADQTTYRNRRHGCIAVYRRARCPKTGPRWEPVSPRTTTRGRCCAQ